MNRRFLFVGARVLGYWLTETTAEFLTLDITGRENMQEYLDVAKYTAIILDAGSFSDVGYLIQEVHAKDRETMVIVATSSPTWRHAREAFHSGAADYIPYREELVKRLRAILCETPSE